MSADKYPCIFSRQMETIVYLYHTYRQFSTTWPSSCKVNCDISVLTKYRVIYNLAYIFHPGMRIWSVSVSWREIEVFSSQA